MRGQRSGCYDASKHIATTRLEKIKKNDKIKVGKWIEGENSDRVTITDRLVNSYEKIIQHVLYVSNFIFHS